MDKANKTKDNNRRVSFRIYDRVNLFYKKIDEKRLAEPYPAFDNVTNDFLLPSEPEKVSQDLAVPTPRLDEELPEDMQFDEDDALNVNISASGMAFTCDDAFKEGDYLVIRLLLLSSLASIVTYCKVVYCKATNPYETHHPYLVGAHFVSLKDQDQELLSKHVDKKKMQQTVVKGFILVAVLTVIAMPDVVFGLLLELLHHLFELFLEFCHLAFEFIEINLDKLIEHFFETEVHETQVIVFYIIASFVFYGLYRLYRVVPPFCRRLKKNQVAYWSRKKASLRFYWREQSLFNKIKLVVIGVAAITGYIFLGM
jgi:hypothetical protein